MRLQISVPKKSVLRFERRELEKIPYMLVVGQQEEADGTVSVRSRFAGDEGVKPLKEFISAVCEEIRTKEIRRGNCCRKNKNKITDVPFCARFVRKRDYTFKN